MKPQRWTEAPNGGNCSRLLIWATVPAAPAQELYTDAADHQPPDMEDEDEEEEKGGKDGMGDGELPPIEALKKVPIPTPSSIPTLAGAPEAAPLARPVQASNDVAAKRARVASLRAELQVLDDSQTVPGTSSHPTQQSQAVAASCSPAKSASPLQETPSPKIPLFTPPTKYEVDLPAGKAGADSGLKKAKVQELRDRIALLKTKMVSPAFLGLSNGSQMAYMAKWVKAFWASGVRVRSNL